MFSSEKNKMLLWNILLENYSSTTKSNVLQVVFETTFTSFVNTKALDGTPLIELNKDFVSSIHHAIIQQNQQQQQQPRRRKLTILPDDFSDIKHQDTKDFFQDYHAIKSDFEASMHVPIDTTVQIEDTNIEEPKIGVTELQQLLDNTIQQRNLELAVPDKRTVSFSTEDLVINDNTSIKHKLVLLRDILSEVIESL